MKVLGSDISMIRGAINVAQLLLRFLRWKCHVWLPDYLRKVGGARNTAELGNEITDIILLIVDHYEPSRKEGEIGVRRVKEWCESYVSMTERHQDSDGVSPQHSWFYRYDYPNDECVRILSEYVYRGFGEIEFHLHHGNDTEESFAETIRQGVEWFNEFGAMLTAERQPQQRFAYIAGNWALDNGRRDASMSGVNSELSILCQAGCYADFTFPAFSVNAQPKVVNSIYYSQDTPEPKSYDTGVPMRVGGAASGDLLIFEGPLCVDWLEGYIEYAALESFAPYFRQRIDLWVKAGVGVVDRPEWLFIKLHTHGMQSREMFLGEQLDRLYSDLEDLCKRSRCRLHYVNAREAYNIAKAAEANRSGDAGLYRDFEIAKPINRCVFINARARVTTYSLEHVSVTVTRPRPDTIMLFREHPLEAIQGGMLTGIELICRQGELVELHLAGSGTCRIKTKTQWKCGSTEVEVTLPFSYQAPIERVSHK